MGSREVEDLSTALNLTVATAGELLSRNLRIDLLAVALESDYDRSKEQLTLFTDQKDPGRATPLTDFL